MRWIVRARACTSASSWSRSPPRMMVARRAADPEDAGGRLSRVRATTGRNPDACASACRPRDVESLVTVPLEQVLNGIDGLGATCAPSPSHSCQHPADLQAGHRPAARPAAGAGAAGDRDAEPADLGRAAGDDAAAVGDQPGHEDRHDVEGPVADRDVHDGVLDDPRAHPAGRRASPTSPSGASACR